MQSDSLQEAGVALEAHQGEVKNDAAEHEQNDVEELDLGLVDDGSQHQVHGRHQHNYGDDNRDLWKQNIRVKTHVILVGLDNPETCAEGFLAEILLQPEVLPRNPN